MSFNTENAVKYSNMHFKQDLEELIELVKIPSCSWETSDPKHLFDSAQKIKTLFKELPLENIEILTIRDAPPYIYADWLHAGKDKPTVLLYAHHDVQPPMREELWVSPPYEPQKRNGRLYGRGTADDKAGIIVHIASLRSYFETHDGKLPINVRILIEGEEEIGSPHLEEFLNTYNEKLKADVMIIADLSNYDTGIPSLTTSLRGLVSMDVEIKSIDHPLHSGMFSGPIPDPNIAMAKIIANITDDQGRIRIPELYNMIDYLTDEERQELKQLNMTDEIYKKQVEMLGEAKIIGGDSSVLEKLWRLPAFIVNSIESGSRKSAGNVVMDSCWAKFGLRLAPGMDPKKTADLMQIKIKELCPWGLNITVTLDSIASAWKTEPTHLYFKIAKSALSKGFGRDAVSIGCGGTIGFVGPLSQHLGNIPAILIGVEDPYCNAHSENESLHIDDFKKAIRSQIYMFSAFSEARI